MAAGLGPMEADECQVNLPVFDAFAQFLATDQRLRHRPVWRTLTEGFVVTVLAIADRAHLLDLWAPPSDPLEADLRQRARVLGPSLSR